MNRAIISLFFGIFTVIASANQPLTVKITNYYQGPVHFVIKKGNQNVSLPNEFTLGRGQSITASVNPNQPEPYCNSVEPFTSSAYVAFYDTKTSNDGYFGIGLACVNNQVVASMNGLNGRGFNIFTRDGLQAILQIQSGMPTN